MKLVRFKKQYSPDWDFNISYELVSDEITLEPLYYNEKMKSWFCDFCYNVKLLGFIPAHKLEITNDPKDIPAIDIFVKLSNL